MSMTTDKRDMLGRMVREVWVAWAREQPNPKPSWLIPYDSLEEPDKEADRRIGEALWRFGAHEAAEMAIPATAELIALGAELRDHAGFADAIRRTVGTFARMVKATVMK